MATTSRQPPPLQALGVHRIVEVPRVLPIDGDQRQLAQILAARPVFGQHVGGEEVRLVQYLGRKLLRQIVPQDGKARREIRRAHAGEHLDDAPVRRLIALRPSGDLHDDVVAVPRTVRESRRHLHGIPMSGILRLHLSLADMRVVHAADPRAAHRRCGGSTARRGVRGH